MKIAFDCQTFCYQSYGGISRYFVRLAQGLLSNEQQVGIFAPLHRNRHVDDLPAGILHGHALPDYPPKTTRILVACNQWIARRPIRKWAPAIVHETYYSARGSGLAGVPTVLTVHDMIHEICRSEFSRGDATSALKRAAINRADHVICISESTRNDLLKFFDVPPDNVSVVHHGFERFQGKTLETGRKVPSRPFLLFVGQREGYKNFSGLLEAIASSRALRRDFDIVAFGGGRFTPAELARINGLGLGEQQVRQIGGHDAVLAQLYDDASAFVYPSRYEGFGLPPLEAMARRCPVVSSNSSSMPEVIGPAAEYFLPESPVDMAAAIDRVVYSPSRRAELELAGLQRLALYDWRKCADQTLDIYRRLAGGLS